MEKLIALLDEYEWPELEHTIIDNEIKRRVKNMVDPDKPYKWCSIWWYSKSFWFIKWLVDNDKIDLLRLDNRIALSEFNKCERVLMALSIQDSPIDFLTKIIKN